ncbi:MAG: hypothetical protein WBW79_09550, partial [Desulfocapsaceae bacterium]
MIVCVANIGSTSLKSSILHVSNDNHQSILGEASLDRINESAESAFSFTNCDGVSGTEMVRVRGYEQGIEFILSWYVEKGILASIESIDCVG